MQAIVPFLVTILQTEKYDAPVKQSAGQTLIIMIENRPILVAKKDLVTPLLTAMVDMVAKSDSSAAGSLFSFGENRGAGGEDDDDEDEDDDDFSNAMDVHRLAQTIIDCMAMNIPSKYFVNPALTLCAQGMASQDPQMRKAGCAGTYVHHDCCRTLYVHLCSVIRWIECAC